MNEKGKTGNLYPMLFGVSCALVSLTDSSGDERNRIETTGLVGLLLWRIQREEQLQSKLKVAEMEIEELKRRRMEDAKANEKVVSIFAAHEQRWLIERKKLSQQIQALMNKLQVMNTKREQIESELKEQQEIVKLVQKSNEELREKMKREGEDHSKEIWKHKSAFIELVSTQRQLEAEMGRAVRQIEAEKQEIDSILEQKEQYVLMAQKLSIELIKTRKDLEQKDEILSAMLRKSKMDIAGEKQMLRKEVKMSKSLRSMLSRHHKSKPEAVAGGKAVRSVAAPPSRTRSQPANQQSEFTGEEDIISPFSQQSITEASQELADLRQLEGWVQSEAKKYANVLEQRHQLEMNAFAEQLRLKDEKLEAFLLHSMSMDTELKRLTKLQEQNFKVEALLSDRESELHALKQKSKSESESQKDQEVRSQEILEENGFKNAVLMIQDKKDTINGEIVPLSTWKMDLHALGVFYKIKRLKQQLIMFDRHIGKQESCEISEIDDEKRRFYSLVSLVNKQVNRYQSLQEKANDICKRMHENNQDFNNGGSIAAKSKDETKKLELFLEETFQLQRYIVATGQKLMEIQSNIASGFVVVQDNEFDMKKFADCIRTLFREIQRGLEVRISRIIGDLEGPLAWDGMIHPRT